jgi:hypothetical protein
LNSASKDLKIDNATSKELFSFLRNNEIRAVEKTEACGYKRLPGGKSMQKKVAEVNLEYDMPTVDVAMQRMSNALATQKRLGFKSVILIHGYGSTGVGGSIKKAVHKRLGESSMRGLVRAFVPGEEWQSRKREFVGMCKALENHQYDIADNYGVTVVILK